MITQTILIADADESENRTMYDNNLPMLYGDAYYDGFQPDRSREAAKSDLDDYDTDELMEELERRENGLTAKEKEEDTPLLIIGLVVITVVFLLWWWFSEP